MKSKLSFILLPLTPIAIVYFTFNLIEVNEKSLPKAWSEADIEINSSVL